MLWVKLSEIERDMHEFVLDLDMTLTTQTLSTVDIHGYLQ